MTEHIGNIIKEFRKFLALNQEEFGKLIDPEKPIHQTTISRYESEGYKFDMEVRIARNIVQLARERGFRKIRTLGDLYGDG